MKKSSIKSSQAERKETMNIRIFQINARISILPLLIAMALLALAAAPVLADAHVEFGAWSAPINVGPPLNTQSPAFYANDDLGVSTIYFGSNRPGSADFDIYQTTTMDEDLESAVWSPGVLVPELSSPGRDTRTFVRRDGREIFLTSDRTGAVGRPRYLGCHAPEPFRSLVHPNQCWPACPQCCR